MHTSVDCHLVVVNIELFIFFNENFIILFHLSESDIVAEHETSIGSTFAPYNRLGRIDAKSGIRLIMHHRICNSK